MEKVTSRAGASRRKAQNPRRVIPAAESTSSTSGTGQRVPTPIRKRYPACARALMETRKYQKAAELLTRKAPFLLLVQEICSEFPRGVARLWQNKALEALQEASQAYLEYVLNAAYLWKLYVHNMQVARRIRGADPGLG